MDATNFTGSGIMASIGVAIGAIATSFLNNRQKSTELIFSESAILRREWKERSLELQENYNKLMVENSNWQKKYYIDISILKEETFVLKADIASLKLQISMLEKSSRD
jgi:hypothetical protein